MEKRKKEIFFQTPLFPPVKSWKMKGLLGINYRQHLADEEDYADAIPVDQEEVVTQIIPFLFWGETDFLCSLQVASFWEAQNTIFCATIFLSG